MEHPYFSVPDCNLANAGAGLVLLNRSTDVEREGQGGAAFSRAYFWLGAVADGL